VRGQGLGGWGAGCNTVSRSRYRKWGRDWEHGLGVCARRRGYEYEKVWNAEAGMGAGVGAGAAPSPEC
jgi:hypothetical protein